jgi:hypothetical protein
MWKSSSSDEDFLERYCSNFMKFKQGMREDIPFLLAALKEK